MGTIDIQDAYFMISIHDDHRKLPRFEWDSVLYQFTCLPVGLNIGPYIFSKIVRVVTTHLRKMGFTSSDYLDDIICIEDNYLECQEN